MVMRSRDYLDVALPRRRSRCRHRDDHDRNQAGGEEGD